MNSINIRLHQFFELSIFLKACLALFEVISGFSLLFIPSRYFLAVYLLSHGIVKIFIVWSLYKEKKWSYPVAIIIFGLLTIYEIIRYTHTHMLTLLAVIVLDIFVIILTLFEYQNKTLNVDKLK
jgi:uncharacterized membrane protein